MPLKTLSFPRTVLLFVLLALAARLLFVAVVFDPGPTFSDEVNYLRNAELVDQGNWLGHTVKHVPGLFYVPALFHKAGLGLPAIRVLQSILGALTVALVMVLGRRLFGAATGVVAGAVTAVYPYLLYLSGVMYAQPYVIPLLVLMVWALYKRQDGGSWLWLLAAAGSLSLAGHFMSTVFLVAPFLAAWHWIRTTRFSDALIWGVTTVVLLVPVTLRNYELADRFVFISDYGPFSLFIASHPELDPRERDSDTFNRISVEIEQEQLELGWTEAQRDSALMARARGFIVDDPGRFVRNLGIRAKTMWWPMPNTWTKNQHTSSKKLLLAGVSCAPVLLLCLIGGWSLRRRFWELLPLYLIPLVITAAHLPFNITVRYRLAFEPFLILFAASVLVLWASKYSRRIAPPRASVP